MGPRHRRAPLALGLALLAALPLLGVGGLAWLHAHEGSDTADLADEIRSTTQEMVDMVRLRSALGAERIPSQARVMGPGFNLDASVISQVLGFDIDEAISTRRPGTDEAASRLSDARWPASHDELLAGARAIVDEGVGDPEEVDDAYERLENAADEGSLVAFERLGRLIADLPDAGAVHDALEGLEAAYLVQEASQGSIRDLAAGILSADAESARRSLINRAHVYRTNTAVLLDRLDPDQVADFTAIDRRPQVATYVAAIDDAARAGSDLPDMRASISELGDIFQGGLERGALLLEFVALTAREVQGAAGEVRDDALDVYRTMMLVVLAIAGVTGLGTLVLARSMVRPLARLEARAEQLQRGDLDVADDPIGGPREVAVVAAAFDAAMATLHRFQAQADALASGRMDAPELAVPLPGRMGHAMHDSVERLSESIRERERLQSQLVHEASHDALTGLPNRASALRHLERLLAPPADVDSAPPRPVGLLFIDLDGFKEVNDTHGHAVGDRFLEGVASRLSEAAGPDRFVARLGGDEFVVVAEMEDSREALRLGSEVLAALQQPLVADDLMLVTDGACIGVAMGTAGSHDPTQLLKAADIALYESKDAGRGTVTLFDDELASRTAERDMVERLLPAAIRRDELEVHYQPIVDAMSGRTVSVEALVRWRHPDRGLLLPDQFLGVADGSELIRAIDLHVLRRALADLVRWDHQGLPNDLSMSVNLSRRQLLSPTLFHDIDRALSESGVDPRRLVVEISERTLISDLADTTDRLTQLRELGVSVAIDDFGAGYTSIGHLRLPVDVVKVDQSIVRSLSQDRELTLLTMFGEVASRLGLRMVAEGVEHESTLVAVKRAGCDLIQGHLMAAAMPSTQMASWLRARVDDVIDTLDTLR